MTKPFRDIVLAMAVCLASLTSAVAQVPSGTYFIDFDTPESALWDFGGDYVFTQSMKGAGGEPVELSFGAPIVHNSYGKLTNAGLTFLAIGSDIVAANYTLKGRAYGGGEKVTQVSLTATLSGEDVIGGAQRKFDGKINYTLYVDSFNSVLYGTAKGSLSVNGIGKMSIQDYDYVMALPGNMNGTWRLQMDITPLAKLAGPASATLSNGRVIPFTLSGSYNTKDNTSKIQGTSDKTGTEPGNSFKTTFGVDTLNQLLLYSLKGQMLGQKPIQ
jgi:hypothetical protein